MKQTMKHWDGFQDPNFVFSPWRQNDDQGLEQSHHQGDIVMGGQMMWNRKSNTLVVRPGEKLDLTLIGLFRQAIQTILTVAPRTLVVDLSATHKVFDSGMALLLLLNHHAGHLQERIVLANGGPRVYGRLARAGILYHFRWS